MLRRNRREGGEPQGKGIEGAGAMTSESTFEKKKAWEKKNQSCKGAQGKVSRRFWGGTAVSQGPGMARTRPQCAVHKSRIR